jgi:para-nitrobenzyl esterase
MKESLKCAIFILLGNLAFQNSASTGEVAIKTGLEFTTEGGKIRGHIEGHTRVFLGIPYVAPPVVELRWRPPQRVHPWKGVKEVQTVSPMCLQSGGKEHGKGIEDCLYLNIWTPTSTSAERLPVMLWIHGGGLRFGSGSWKSFDGQRLSEVENVVVVTFNYRVGALGFLALEELSSESQSGLSGVYGFLDQVAALEWVQRNIGTFGGDPSNVTIFGESAGGISVCHHLASHRSRGLFHRAIIQSAPCLSSSPSFSEAKIAGRRLVEDIGCDKAPEVLTCLRSKNARELTDTLKPMGRDPGGTFFQTQDDIWAPPISVAPDGIFLTRSITEAFRNGDVADVPVILGANSDEGTLFVFNSRVPDDEASYEAALQRRYGERTYEVLQQYPLKDFDNASSALAEVSGDEVLFCQAPAIARLLQRAGSQVYLYHFTRALENLPDPWLGVLHTGEIPFVFNNDHFLAKLTEQEKHFAGTVMKYWGQFAATGNPNVSTLSQWPRLSGNMTQHLLLGQDVKVADVYDKQKKCAFWKEFRQWP